MADIDRNKVFEQAVQAVLESNQAEVSVLREGLRISYYQSSILMEIMEQAGIVAPQISGKPREILITLKQWESGETNDPKINTIKKAAREIIKNFYQE